MQGHMEVHMSWEDQRGQDQDGKGKNKASSVPQGSIAWQSGIRSCVCEASNHKFNRSMNHFVDDPKHRELIVLSPGLPDCFQKN